MSEALVDYGYTNDLGLLNQATDSIALLQLGLDASETTKKSPYDHNVNRWRVESKAWHLTDFNKLSHKDRDSQIGNRHIDHLILTTGPDYDAAPVRAYCRKRRIEVTHIVVDMKELVKQILATKRTPSLKDSLLPAMVESLVKIKVKALSKFKHLFEKQRRSKFQTIIAHFTQIRLKVKSIIKVLSDTLVKLVAHGRTETQNTIAGKLLINMKRTSSTKNITIINLNPVIISKRLLSMIDENVNFLTKILTSSSSHLIKNKKEECNSFYVPLTENENYCSMAEKDNSVSRIGKASIRRNIFLSFLYSLIK